MENRCTIISPKLNLPESGLTLCCPEGMVTFGMLECRNAWANPSTQGQNIPQSQRDDPKSNEYLCSLVKGRAHPVCPGIKTGTELEWELKGSKKTGISKPNEWIIIILLLAVLGGIFFFAWPR